jgi:hypothetical protein
MRGKLRFAMICGIVLIFGASAVAVGKRAKKEGDDEKDKTEAVAEPAAPVAGGDAEAPKIDVKCNIPPIKVNVTPAAAPPAGGKPAGKAGKTAKAPLFDWSKIGKDMVLTVIFSLLGLLVALFGYFVYHWIVPFDLRKELEIDQNTSLGIVLGAIILGLCIIVAAAIASP